MRKSAGLSALWLWAQARAWRNRILLTPLILLALNSIALFATYAVNTLMPADRTTAVFLSVGYDYGPFSEEFTASFCRFLGYVPITLQQNLNGYRVVWYQSPTKEDVLAVLASTNHESLVFAGHGDHSGFLASDSAIELTDILERGVPKRFGTLTMHTCGAGEGISMAETLLEDPKKVFRWYRVITPFENYIGVWRHLIDAGYRPPREKQHAD